MIENVPLVGLSAPAILGLAVIFLLTGRIVPRATLKDKADESERWRLAYEAEREARSKSEAQTTQLLEVAKTTQALISGLFANSERIREAGEMDVSRKPE